MALAMVRRPAYQGDNGMAYQKLEVRGVELFFRPYAQYSATVRVRFTPRDATFSGSTAGSLAPRRRSDVSRARFPRRSDMRNARAEPS
jgi:hypothetical protein